MRFDNLPEPALSYRGVPVYFDDPCRSEWWGVDLATKPDQSAWTPALKPGDVSRLDLVAAMERAWRQVNESRNQPRYIGIDGWMIDLLEHGTGNGLTRGPDFKHWRDRRAHLLRGRRR